ncbi:hypothetical protein J6590_087783 [Homalodisca vitripennis]|nr:hypothetical protein J6590_087783 [Homalodisca vitripennis]
MDRITSTVCRAESPRNEIITSAVLRTGRGQTVVNSTVCRAESPRNEIITSAVLRTTVDRQ